MIGRYTRPEMGRIWELENKFAIWKEIEVLACEAQAELGQSGITKRGSRVDPRRTPTSPWSAIDEIEKVTNHDVIAFTTNMAELHRRRHARGQPSRRAAGCTTA